jgi:DNA-binding response OmpR family regulator
MENVRSLSVLIVEDNHDGAESLAELLRIYGHEVHTANDGEMAEGLARAFPPDAVILDLELPGMDGLAVAGCLNALLGRKPLLIVITGHTKMRAECLAAGIDHYFLKPVVPAVLDDLLRSYSKTLPGAEWSSNGEVQQWRGR